jgi:broad specificity phosphatase PhoE
MSDLQCPATLLIAATEMGPGRVHDLVEQLRGRRVAAVYASLGQAAELARLAASELDLPEPRFSDALGEPADLGDPAAGSQLVIERFTRVIDEIADVHRGEAVLVFTYDQLMGLAIPGATGQPELDGGVIPVTEMEVDGDGWRLRAG